MLGKSCNFKWVAKEGLAETKSFQKRAVRSENYSGRRNIHSKTPKQGFAYTFKEKRTANGESRNVSGVGVVLWLGKREKNQA